jgi:hypothetical protein
MPAADTTIALRVPRSVRQRAQRLRKQMADSTLGAVGQVTESAVLKLALAHGLPRWSRSMAGTDKSSWTLPKWNGEP